MCLIFNTYKQVKYSRWDYKKIPANRLIYRDFLYILFFITRKFIPKNSQKKVHILKNTGAE